MSRSWDYYGALSTVLTYLSLYRYILKIATGFLQQSQIVGTSIWQGIRLNNKAQVYAV